MRPQYEDSTATIGETLETAAILAAVAFAVWLFFKAWEMFDNARDARRKSRSNDEQDTPPGGARD